MIFETKHFAIPLADVQHIEKSFNAKGEANGFQVITRHTRWDKEGGWWSNNMYVGTDHAEAFMVAWREFHAQKDGDVYDRLSSIIRPALAERTVPLDQHGDYVARVRIQHVDDDVDKAPVFSMSFPLVRH